MNIILKNRSLWLVNFHLYVKICFKHVSILLYIYFFSFEFIFAEPVFIMHHTIRLTRKLILILI